MARKALKTEQSMVKQDVVLALPPKNEVPVAVVIQDNIKEPINVINTQKSDIDVAQAKESSPIVIVEEKTPEVVAENTPKVPENVNLVEEPQLVPELVESIEEPKERNVTYHIVSKGENLYRISLLYNIKMQRLIEWNGLAEPPAIYNGMKLSLVAPDPVE